MACQSHAPRSERTNCKHKQRVHAMDGNIGNSCCCLPRAPLEPPFAGAKQERGPFGTPLAGATLDIHPSSDQTRLFLLAVHIKVWACSDGSRGCDLAPLLVKTLAKSPDVRARGLFEARAVSNIDSRNYVQDRDCACGLLWCCGKLRQPQWQWKQRRRRAWQPAATCWPAKSQHLQATSVASAWQQAPPLMAHCGSV